MDKNAAMKAVKNVLRNIVLNTIMKFSMSEALPMISALHFGQITAFKLDLNMNIKR